MNWIKCGDAMPDEGEVVVIALAIDDVREWLDVARVEQGHFQAKEESIWIGDDLVTHWMRIERP